VRWTHVKAVSTRKRVRCPFEEAPTWRAVLLRRVGERDRSTASCPEVDADPVRQLVPMTLCLVPATLGQVNR
jgi:hypothetical protein